jgi:hypothetical protein
MHVWRSDSPTIASVVGTGLLFLFIPAFTRGEFSFGYILGVRLYLAVAGFVWLSFYSEFDYPHVTARWSMVASFASAIIPLMFLNLPLRRASLSKEGWQRSSILLLAFSLCVLVADAAYGISFGDPYGNARNLVTRPTALNYLTGIIIGAVLPYLFAYFACNKHWRLAIGALALACCYYPVVVNKTVILLPIWLPFLFWLFGRFEPRFAMVLSLLIPLAIGMLDFVTGLYFPDKELFRFRPHQP